MVIFRGWGWENGGGVTANFHHFRSGERFLKSVVLAVQPINTLEATELYILKE